jgi:hypothetical protein
MFCIRKIQFLMVVALAVACLAASATILAQSPATKLPNITYTATGTFSSPQVSGNDLFKLAGEPFSINVVANEADTPHQHTKGWADYTGLRMKGKVTSALIPQSPFTIESAHTFIVLALGNPSFDIFELSAPVIVVKQKVTISAKLDLPRGTFGKGWINFPFTAAATLDPSSGTVTYSDGTNATTLTIASGTLNAQKGVPQ